MSRDATRPGRVEKEDGQAALRGLQRKGRALSENWRGARSPFRRDHPAGHAAGEGPNVTLCFLLSAGPMCTSSAVSRGLNTVYVCPSFPNQTICAMDGRASGRRRGPRKMPDGLQEVIFFAQNSGHFCRNEQTRTSIETPVNAAGRQFRIPSTFHIADTDPLVAPHAMEISEEDPRSILWTDQCM
ncbi:hypothetical protein EDB87DRAFT_1627008 [Lactarius vividus]|nr:hypothetical protein EDB87DRAFT_1627008 [Lactarius vividus]